MKQSTERILTTHTGSLPRPPDLIPVLYARERGEAVDESAFEESVRSAVAGIVRKQIEAGIDVVNDGEQSKVSYATYVKDRLTGFGGEGTAIVAADVTDFPEYASRSARGGSNRRPACNGPIEYHDLPAVERDIANFRAALQGVSPKDTFLSAASPGVISIFMGNQYYPSHEDYIWAMARAMKSEYDAIHRAGFVLQIDCPDLAMSRHSKFAGTSLEEFRRIASVHVEALNYATQDIPPEMMRMHLCWGNYEGPHHRDVELRNIVDIVLGARPAGISFEASNPRHAHEWTVWEDVRLPDGKVLIPGMLDSTCNFIEHPELVAQRLVRFAGVVGRENVIAGTDCGFSTGAGGSAVDPAIAWAKFQAMAEGARLASSELW